MAASALLEANPPAGEGYTVEELAAVVRAAHGGADPGGTRLPLGALTGEPAQDTGLLLAMEYLCRQCGIEAVIAWGQEPREDWLIVSTPDGYRHLLAGSLHPQPEDPEGEGLEPPVPLYTDQGLAELGYEWSAPLYPACVDEGEAAE